jgi:hypothetical protein
MNTYSVESGVINISQIFMHCIVIYLNLPGLELGWKPVTATELETKIISSFEQSILNVCIYTLEDCPFISVET